MSRSHSRLRIPGVLLASALVAASCGGGSTGESETFNTSDVMFAQMMIPHHEQAIELADMALDPASGAGSDVVSLATAIKAAQDPEIEQMKGLLGDWGMSMTMDTSMDHGSMMSGMLSADELAAIDALTGAEFDRAWMEAMIDHHEGAIDMAEDVIADGKDAAIRTLANAIIEAQRAEIARMTELLGS